MFSANSGGLPSGAVAPIVGGSEPSDLFGAAITLGDFNGDGFLDTAIGVPGEDVAGVINAGAVNVIYGSASGLTGGVTQIENELWHQNSPLVPDAIETNDQFGKAVAAGDFNGDGIDDLAIGIPDHPGLVQRRFQR